jgi:hypothetical protein
MAVSILFGMTAATFFTMIVIPLGCISAEKRFRKHGCAALEERINKEDEAVKAPG